MSFSKNYNKHVLDFFLALILCYTIFHWFLFPEHYISKQEMITSVKNISEVFKTKIHKNILKQTPNFFYCQTKCQRFSGLQNYVFWSVNFFPPGDFRFLIDS